MSVIDQLASSLNRRDEIPNQDLAQKIVAEKNSDAIEELIDNLFNKNSAIQHDCIKVLYEIGYLQPKLIAKYANTFIRLLDHKNNRMQWGAMTALSAVVNENPKVLFENLSKIIETANNGSVISKDHAINILIGIASIKPYSDKAFGILISQLEKAFPNQLPMYAEKSLAVVNKKNREAFIHTLKNRMVDLEKESKKKRVEKVIAKADNIK